MKLIDSFRIKSRELINPYFGPFRIYLLYRMDSQIILTDSVCKDRVEDDTTYFRRYINLINWLSGKPFKKKQTLK